MHAAAANPHRLGTSTLIARRGRLCLSRCIAKSNCVETVDGNLVFGNEITLDRFGQTLGALDAYATRCRGVSFHLENVTVAAGESGSKLIKLLFGVRGQHRGAGAEGDVKIGNRMELVNAADGGVQLVYVARSLLRGVAGSLCFAVRGHRCLVGLIG